MYLEQHYIDQMLKETPEPDQAYWVDYHHIRVNRSLVISQEGDASIWLLDPETQNEAGEWAAGRWSSWNPAMEWISDSFAGLFRDEFETYLRLRAGEE